MDNLCHRCIHSSVCEEYNADLGMVRRVCDYYDSQFIDRDSVAPVVRCRECKFYREVRTKRYNQLMRLCYRMGKHDMEFPVKPDDFCSYGQRKETSHA